MAQIANATIPDISVINKEMPIPGVTNSNSSFQNTDFFESIEKRGVIASFTIPGKDGKNGQIPFYYYTPAKLIACPGTPKPQSPTALLLLIPGYNGSGQAMLDRRWQKFADDHSLILLAPTFTNINSQELHQNRGYYFPEMGSGDEVEKALLEVHWRTGVPVEKILIFGFSAGAHFAHRFALWRPDQVHAFVAYSAGWWSDPTARLHDVPALIMCGESDERFEATRAFMEKGISLHLPWIWRSYKDTNHQLTSPVRSMAEVFLDYHADLMGQSGRVSMNNPEGLMYGDLQSYKVYPENQRNMIPEAVRIMLPSRKVAAVWQLEN